VSVTAATLWIAVGRQRTTGGTGRGMRRIHG